jgi:hypothetical protein
LLLMCHEFAECRECIRRGLHTIRSSQLVVKVL